MKKTLLIIMAIAMTVLLLAGCGAATMDESAEMSYKQDAGGASNDHLLSGDNPESAPAAEPSPYVTEEMIADGGYYEEGRKAIKTADAQIEVLDFQKAYDAIKAMIGNDGYIEETNIWKTPSYHNGEQIMLTNGSIRIRIKQENFTAFTEGLKTIGTVLSSRALTDDISDMYYDTEARLELLRNEKERLEQYAGNLEDAEVFFETQSRITQVIYEMENLQGTLKKWDSKVEFSTVTITISEKHPDDDPAVSKPKGFFEKIWDNMKDSVGFLGDVVIFLFGILPVLFVVAVVVTAFVIIVKKTAGRKTPPDKKQ